MDIEKYNSLINDIFQRFPSVQTSSFNDAYKPGLQHMTDFNNLLGNPDKNYRTIHVAGTNGKGSVANMLSSVLAGAGLKVGLYTSRTSSISVRECVSWMEAHQNLFPRNMSMISSKSGPSCSIKWNSPFSR